jgi:DNA polymerase III gamma/tau subunit
VAAEGYLERIMALQFSWKFVPVAVALLAFGPFAAAGAASANALDPLISKHSAASGVPESLIRRVIHIESKGNPRVVSAGNYGLMQIRLGTARAMGYTGDVNGLLDADTNMTYAVRYLAGALRAAEGNHEKAIRNYQRGYYDRAKAKGFSPYAVASVPPQAAAPDPTLVRQQEEADRRRTAEQERKARQQALIEQQKAAEQSRAAERQAIQQQRAEQRRAAEEARAAQRQAALQERAERQQAAKQKQIEQRQAALQQRKLEQDARQTPPAPAVPAATPEPAVRAAPKPSTAPRRTADGGYSWYNPMRYFTHPMHRSHPIQRER